MPTCDNCGKPFDVDSRALNKRFCSKDCRLRWHSAERQRQSDLLPEVLKLLRRVYKDENFMTSQSKRDIQQMLKQMGDTEI
jgi:hypothetical protein